MIENYSVMLVTHLKSFVGRENLHCQLYQCCQSTILLQSFIVTRYKFGHTVIVLTQNYRIKETNFLRFYLALWSREGAIGLSSFSPGSCHQPDATSSLLTNINVTNSVNHKLCTRAQSVTAVTCHVLCLSLFSVISENTLYFLTL
jgi:hypothetical protein